MCAPMGPDSRSQDGVRDVLPAPDPSSDARNSEQGFVTKIRRGISLSQVIVLQSLVVLAIASMLARSFDCLSCLHHSQTLALTKTVPPAPKVRHAERRCDKCCSGSFFLSPPLGLCLSAPLPPLPPPPPPPAPNRPAPLTPSPPHPPLPLDCNYQHHL
jgi:hypothetical protein